MVFVSHNYSFFKYTKLNGETDIPKKKKKKEPLSRYVNNRMIYSAQRYYMQCTSVRSNDQDPRA